MRYYSEDHEWVEVIGDKAITGITEFAAELIGNIHYVELPEEGNDLIIGDTLGVIESDDAEYDLYSPISGTVVAVNDSLEDDPNLMIESPEQKGWICKFINIDSSELNDMMNQEAYARYTRDLRK